VYLSKALLFHLPHLRIGTLSAKDGQAAKALGKAARKDLQL
jgi:hypothetical protein